MTLDPGRVSRNASRWYRVQREHVYFRERHVPVMYMTQRGCLLKSVA